ncbi:MAG TPA: hypothetical protein VHE35_25640, partial [Kofleriaceae bacterium]|nr:hypothetical protein [Kofleriaceae bacterium]
MRPSDPTAPISLVPRAEVSRRDALRLIAAGVAALEAGCLSRAGDEEIVPYAIDPEDRAASARVRYATALVVDGFATGAIVETADGRPIKLDGNPAHPANLGGSTPWMQARVLDLWDPQRARAASIAGAPADRAAIDAALRALPAGPLWLVLPPVSSPSIVAMLARVRAAQAQAGREVHVVYDAPLDHRDAYRGHALAFGRPLEQQLDLARADVVVALDADPLAAMPMSPAWARAAAARRTPDRRMSRLWVAEPVPTPTGTIADERLPAAARDVAAVAVALAASIAAGGGSIATLPPALVAR